MNLNTLKDGKREDCCFVDEEEAIVLSSQPFSRPAQAVLFRLNPFLFRSELKFRAPHTILCAPENKLELLPHGEDNNSAYCA